MRCGAWRGSGIIESMNSSILLRTSHLQLSHAILSRLATLCRFLPRTARSVRPILRLNPLSSPCHSCHPRLPRLVWRRSCPIPHIQPICWSDSSSMSAIRFLLSVLTRCALSIVHWAASSFPSSILALPPSLRDLRSAFTTCRPLLLPLSVHLLASNLSHHPLHCTVVIIRSQSR
jgi:hypothetical protein